MFDICDHRRDSLGLQYIYAVNSRRSNGLSIGINLNINKACNWRCIYCQVDGLTRGSAPVVDLDILEGELRYVITGILQGKMSLRYNIPRELCVVRDIAISGNGEPTTSREFDQVMALVKAILESSPLPGNPGVTLITNGSMIHRPVVRKGISLLAKMKGEIWFKLDSATDDGIRSVNSVQIPMQIIRRNLVTAASLCPLWLQTCVFERNGQPPSREEQDDYIKFISTLLDDGVPVRGVHLYGIARPSRQKEAPYLGRLPLKWLEDYAERIVKTGVIVNITA